MNGKLVKKVFCVVLSFLVVFNIVYNHSLIVFAEEADWNGNSQELQTEQNREVLSETEQEQDSAIQQEDQDAGNSSGEEPSEGQDAEVPSGEEELEGQEQQETEVPTGEEQNQSEAEEGDTAGEPEEAPDGNQNDGVLPEDLLEEGEPVTPEDEAGLSDVNQIITEDALLLEGQQEEDVPEDSQEEDVPEDGASSHSGRTAVMPEYTDSRNTQRVSQEVQPVADSADHNVYISSEPYGNDANDGRSETTGVKTMERAMELLRERAEYQPDIIMCGVVEVTEEKVWDFGEFDWQPEIIRSPSYKGIMIDIGLGGSLTLKSAIINGNKDNVVANEAAIRNSETLTMENGSVVKNNKMEEVYTTITKCGGIHGGGRLYIRNSSVLDNEGFQAGGIMGGYLEMENGVVSGNKSSSHGGGICFAGSGEGRKIKISGSEIKNNSAPARGGGIFFEEFFDISMEIRDSTISGNSATYGGGIYLSESFSGDECVIDDTLISNNTAEKAGGGIFVTSKRYRFPVPDGWSRGTMTLNGSTIQGNSAPLGGGIAAAHFNLQMRDTSVVSNMASQMGGGIWADPVENTLDISGGVISGNQVAAGGSGSGMGFAENLSLFPYVDPQMRSQYINLNLDNGVLAPDQTIALGDARKDDGTDTMVNIRLMQEVEASQQYTLEIASSHAAHGSLVVEPDGAAVTDAAQYLPNFELSESAGYALIRDGANIILGSAYFVDGVNGNDRRTGQNPADAFKTMEHALALMRNNPGCIYICGEVTVSGSTEWAMTGDQTIWRYEGGNISGVTYPGYTGDMVTVTATGSLLLTNAQIYNSSSQDSAETGYIINQGGELTVSPDTVLTRGTVYLRDEKVIGVTGDYPLLIAEVEKENPRAGDVIGVYTGAGTAHAKTSNFQLGQGMSDFGLGLDGDSKVILTGPVTVYIDGIHGDDSRDGATPENSVLTMKRAYSILKNFGGKIIVVDTVTAKEDMVLQPFLYQGAGVADRVEVTGGRVSIARYSANQHVLFQIEKETLTLDGIVVDGASSGETQSALLWTEPEGTLRVQGSAVLKNNASTGAQGGAIYNEGSTLLYDCVLQDNEAAKGAGVYQNGVLKICSASTELNGAEIYLGTEKYIEIEAAQPQERIYNINMDAEDTESGRIVAVFAEGAYNPAGVSLDAGHFLINPASTTKVLTSWGVDTLVLGSSFGVMLDREEFLGELGTKIEINAVLSFADPSEVTVEVWKDGQKIEAEQENQGWCRKIRIPVTRENTGRLTLKFSHKEAVLEKDVVISSCEIGYDEGRNCLTAQAQSDLIPGLHQNQAEITIYNGNSAQRTLELKSADIAYEDQSEAVLDNQKVSRDMEPEQAMKYFGFTLSGNKTVEADGILKVKAVLSNGDRLTAEKKGNIQLKGFMLGEAQTDLVIPFQTKPYTRAEVSIFRDKVPCGSQRVEIQKASGSRIPLLEPGDLGTKGISSKVFFRGSSNTGTYRLTGVSEGTYQVYLNGKNTKKTIKITVGSTGTARADIYSIHYELNGGESKKALPDSYIEGVGVKLNDPVRKNAVFQGWYTHKEFKGDRLSSISSKASGSLTLYAKWSVNSAVEETPEQPDSPQTSVTDPETPQTSEQPKTPQSPIKKVGNVPKTGDKTVWIITEIAFVGGLSYLMKMFADNEVQVGMTEEKKNSLMQKLIGAARGKNPLIRLGALALIFLFLLFYHTIGHRTAEQSGAAIKNGHLEN